MALKDILGRLFHGKAPQNVPAEGADTVQPRPTEPVQTEPIRGSWAGDMVPREAGRGKSIERSGGGGYMSCGTVRLEWVSRETDADGQPLRTRTPKALTVTVPEVGFLAAGRPYASRAQLTARKDPHGPWAKDVYGRDVLVLAERFPCFDSSDLLYEDRYFRWYFLCRDDKLTCVYHTDDTPTVTVTEDVHDLENQCWQQMKERGCFDV